MISLQNYFSKKKCVKYEDYSIIKDTNSCESKTVGERIMILSEQ